MIAGSLIERSLNHLLRQSPGSAEALVRHAGASVRFDLGAGRFDACIGDDGYFSQAAVDIPDAIVAPTLELFTHLPFSGRGALRFAHYDGDPALLATLDRVFKHIEWDIESDLAPWVGDIAAARLHRFGRHTLAALAAAANALGRNASEYATEEAEMMARAVDVARFNRQVDTLADDAERLATRLRRLEASGR